MPRSKRLYDLVARLWPMTGVALRMSRRPLLGRVMRPLYSTRLHQATIIPVNEAVPPTEHVALPYALLEPLVQRAAARFIMAECLCRSSHDCQKHSPSLGCLYLGEGATHINPCMGRLADADEALRHVQAALDDGLMPLVVHTIFDAYLLGIPFHQMLAICFCCDCCCAIRTGLRLGPPAFWNIVQRLPTLSVEIGANCLECGLCQQVCPVGAITLASQDHGLGSVNQNCKGCGQCVRVCPVGAIRLRIPNEQAILARLLARIEQRTDITSVRSRQV